MIAAGAPKGTVSSNGLLHLVYGGGTDSTDVVAYATARVVFPTGVEDAGKVIPGDMRMEAAYPSPFNESTRVRYRLPRAATVSLRVLDVLAKPVRVLARGQQAAGEHTVRWDGRDDAGQPLPSGVYLIRLEAGGQVATRKVVLVR